MNDHYSCIPCSEKIERRLKKDPYLVERLERSSSLFPGHLFVTTVLVCLILLISTVSMAVLSKAATEREIQIDLRPDPAFDDVAIR